LTVTLPALPDPDFQSGMNELGPLTPAMIKQLHKCQHDTERAHAAQPRFQPKTLNSYLPVNLRPAPGEAPQMVRLYPNFQTNILFYDDYGNALPIVDVSTLDTNYFNVTWTKDTEHPTNSMVIVPAQMYSNGSVSVVLQGVPGRVSLLLASGQHEVDIDARVRVRGIGRRQVVAGVGIPMPQDVDPVMLSILTGVPPDSAKTLRSSNGKVQAWKIGDSFYVRTSFTLLSPAATAIQRGSDGSAVYKIQPTPVLIGLSDGETVKINLSGY
jgi:intracellular multiplication protein IcmK